MTDADVKRWGFFRLLFRGPRKFVIGAVGLLAAYDTVAARVGPLADSVPHLGLSVWAAIGALAFALLAFEGGYQFSATTQAKAKAKIDALTVQVRELQTRTTETAAQVQELTDAGAPSEFRWEGDVSAVKHNRGWSGNRQSRAPQNLRQQRRHERTAEENGVVAVVGSHSISLR